MKKKLKKEIEKKIRKKNKNCPDCPDFWGKIWAKFVLIVLIFGQKCPGPAVFGKIVLLSWQDNKESDWEPCSGDHLTFACFTCIYRTLKSHKNTTSMDSIASNNVPLGQILANNPIY